MKIKYRITLLFTLLVSCILVLVSISVYYFSSANRARDFKNGLRNRALTTAKYLIEVTEKDPNLMKRIDENTVLSLQQKSIYVYNYLNQVLYAYQDSNAAPLLISKEELNKARVEGEFSFRRAGRDVLVTQYLDRFNRYVVVVAAYDANGKNGLLQLKRILLLCSIIGVGIALLTGYFFSRRLVSPITNIIREVEEISAQDLKVRIQAGEGKDELYQLANTFNKLLDRLQETFEIQRRFISNASHELNTPLTAVSSQIEISLQKERDAEEYRSVLESIYSDVFQMGQLTRSLLEIAKTGSGGTIALVEVRIDEVLLKVASDVQKQDSDSTVLLFFEEFPDEESAFLIYGNADLLYSAIRNIVSNACKFSSNKTAQVRLLIGKEKVMVHVEDDGIGIPESERDRIFQPFFRAENARQQKGFGLGLALANRIIRLHRGRIEVQSIAPQGTRFTVFLEPFHPHSTRS
jgi:two-component system sensor histidine kinase ArlS